jgi:hypothetical protein
MKRATGVLASAYLLVLLSAGSALAQTYPPTPSTSVKGGGGTNTAGGGGTAFTGGDVSLGAVLTIVLLGLGLAAMFVARRRAARLAV